MKFAEFALFALLSLPAAAAQNKMEPAPELDTRWSQYTYSLRNLPLQKDCAPKRIWANPKVAHKGVVMMLHGYTACPQQFFDWGAEVAAQGWDVLLPLLPGHGRIPYRADVPGGKYSDDADSLPKKDEWPQFKDFASQMNKIMEAAQGAKVVGGLSVGGAIAMYAIEESPQLYDRALIMTPLL